MTPVSFILALCACSSVLHGAPISHVQTQDDKTSDQHGNDFDRSLRGFKGDGTSPSLRENILHQPSPLTKHGNSVHEESVYPMLDKKNAGPPTNLGRSEQTEKALATENRQELDMDGRDYLSFLGAPPDEHPLGSSYDLAVQNAWDYGSSNSNPGYWYAGKYYYDGVYIGDPPHYQITRQEATLPIDSTGLKATNWETLPKMSERGFKGNDKDTIKKHHITNLQSNNMGVKDVQPTPKSKERSRRDDFGSIISDWYTDYDIINHGIIYDYYYYENYRKGNQKRKNKFLTKSNYKRIPPTKNKSTLLGP